MSAMWKELVKGGITMIPLAIFSVAGLAVFLEKLITLRRKAVLIPEVVQLIENLHSEAEVQELARLCQERPGPLSRIVALTLLHRHLPKEEIEEIIEEQGRQEGRLLERGLVVLETVAGASPLLGLLGTVFGIIKVFNVISVQGVGQASSFSAGISEALITTAAGLSIGIPALVAYNAFAHRAEGLILDIEKYSVILLRRLKALQGGDARDAAP
ncbi:MAG: MotA/TolQ/ExbB proton channel family protein [candidate division KSB1 bacterium]|nr:MotA/TolQ/ExbB proton channel family protein [candidate division KSB1 bacterium]